MTTTLEAPVTRNSINVHGAMEGDILVATWGYDQTNWDYYEVIHVTSKTITLFDLRHHTLLKGKRHPARLLHEHSRPVRCAHQYLQQRVLQS